MVSGEKEPEWLQKWMALIEKIGGYMERTIGKKIVVVNVEAGPDPQENYDRYMEACRVVKDAPEIVVAVSLPGEVRIFWVNQDVQFYIHDGKEKVHVTGNLEVFQDFLL
jgi:hypothetical protein